MMKKIEISGIFIVAIVTLTVTGFGCSKTSSSTTTSSSGTTVDGNTLSFTPQQFAAALAATGTAPQIPGFVTTSYAGSTLLKAPDLQGPNNIVIYDATYGGHYYAINLGVFVGMSLQQAVAAYIQIQNGTGQSITLSNGQTLSLWTPPYPQPATGSSGGVVAGSTGSSGGLSGCVGSSTCLAISTGGSTGSDPLPQGDGYVQGTINVVFPTGNDNSAGVPVFQDPAGNLYDNRSATRDTDLQQANLQQNAIEKNAQDLVNRFQMSFESAEKLSVLADKMKQLTANNQELSDEDRASLSDAAFAVAAVSGDAVNAAAAKMIQTGDKTDVDALVMQAAVNLGMPSAEGLKNEILPSLGINLQ